MGKRIMFWDNARDALLSLVFFLLVLGAVNVFSASYVAAADMFGNGYHYLLRYGIFSLAGLLCHVRHRKEGGLSLAVQV